MKNIRRIIIILLILGSFYVLSDFYKEERIRLVENDFSDNSNLININQIAIEKYVEEKSFFNNEVFNLNNATAKNEFNENKKYQIPNKYLGYEVDGVLEIPKIDLKTYIFDEYSEERMNICPTKLWGPSPNSYGNYSMIGHNYQKENMFNNLIELNVGDEILFTDNTNGEIKYIVYDIYRVKENNVEPVKQKSKEVMEITLITCVNYTNNRLIVKARARTI